jgi:anthranilate synthase/aminodeoxychorismate synthase-like glutamine amidotransferase
MILVIDNYDSFTYNLVQLIGELGGDPRVYRNDEISPDEAVGLGPKGVILSPGPKSPSETEPTNEIVRRFDGHLPLLGVCLGHQCIAHVAGARIVRADRLMHGKTSAIHHDGVGIFEGLSNPFEATRYHSLIVAPETLPESLEPVARTAEGELMGMRHRKHPTWGLQFHPESILSPEGGRLIANFLRLCR